MDTQKTSQESALNRPSEKNRLLTPTGRSIKYYFLRSWLILMSTALLSALLMAFLTVVIDRGNHLDRIQDDLSRIGPQIARRVAEELLIGTAGLPEPVIEHLKTIYDVPVIRLLKPETTCLPNDNSLLPLDESCAEISHKYLWKQETIPAIAETRFIVVAVARPPWFAGFPWKFLFSAAGLVFGTFFLGLSFQRRILEERLLKPLSKLVSGGGESTMDPSWPEELNAIAGQLKDSMLQKNLAIADAHRNQTQALLGKFAELVIHDCQQPLAKAGALIENRTELEPETKRILLSLIDTPRKLIRGALRKYQNQALAADPKEILSDLQKDFGHSEFNIGTPGSVLKRLEREIHLSQGENREVNVVFDIPKKAMTGFVAVSFLDLYRVLSNFLENAVYAAKLGQKRVLVNCNLSDDDVEITIRDFGTGFAPGVLEKIRTGTATTTKGQDGNGHGIISAISLIEKSKGRVQIEPFVDGVLIRISFARIEAPEWFEDIFKRRTDTIVVLDDDLSIKTALEQALPKKSIILTFDVFRFIEEARIQKDSLLLVDLEYGGRLDGLATIAELGMADRAILFSGKLFADEDIVRKAWSRGIRVFPKECLG